MKANEAFDKIEAYLKNELSEADKKDFLADAHSDPALKKAILQHKMADTAIEMAQTDALRDKLTGIRAKVGKLADPVAPPTPLRALLTSTLSKAAAVLAIISATLIGYATMNYSDHALVADFYEMASTDNEKGNAVDIDKLLIRGQYQFYTEQNYNAALNTFQSILQTDPSHLPAQYYTAHCHLKLEQYPAAAAGFTTLLNTSSLPGFIDKETLRWNRLLAYLGSPAQKTEFASELDYFLENEQSPYHAEAKKLQSKTRSFWRNLSISF